MLYNILTLALVLFLQTAHESCDLCRDRWLFVVASGRSGSTTMMEMLTSIPGIYMAGENGDLAGSLFEIHQNLAAKTPANQKIEKCLLQYLAKEIIGSIRKDIQIIGWKEIRYKNIKVLRFMRRIFPCAQFIVNLRHNISAQHRSAFQVRADITALKRQHDMLSSWASHQPPDYVYQLALEEFTPGSSVYTCCDAQQACLCACMCVCMCVRACVCVCVFERKLAFFVIGTGKIPSLGKHMM